MLVKHARIQPPLEAVGETTPSIPSKHKIALDFPYILTLLPVGMRPFLRRESQGSTGSLCRTVPWPLMVTIANKSFLSMALCPVLSSGLIGEIT